MISVKTTIKNCNTYLQTQSEILKNPFNECVSTCVFLQNKVKLNISYKKSKEFPMNFTRESGQNVSEKREFIRHLISTKRYKIQIYFIQNV